MRNCRNMRGFVQNGTMALLLLFFLVTCTNFDACGARRVRHLGSSHHHDHGVGGPKPSPSPPPSPLSPSPPPPSMSNLTSTLDRPALSGTVFNVVDFGASGDGVTDDTKAFENTWQAACKEGGGSTVLVPQNLQFLVGPISFAGANCAPNMVFQLDGTILAPTNHNIWGADLSTWLQFKNLKGLTIQGQGTIEGQGSTWWNSASEAYDNPGENSEMVELMPSNRPTALRISGSNNVAVAGITIQNSPQFHLKFDSCQVVEVHGVTISSPGNSPNTDGIHLQNSQGVSIHNTNLACGDDCISIQTGSSNVFIQNVNCGPGHGISIGGLGKGNTQATVSDVTVQDVTISGTTNGVRIKTWQGGSGSVKNIRYSNVRVSEVQKPIVIDQFYCDHTMCTNQTSAVALSDITYQNIRGTYTLQPVYLACSDAIPCSNIYLDDIELQPSIDNSHVYAPFCWKAYGDLRAPTEPPISCLQSGKP
ncbi:Polygalacturonase [Ananas comosus]|uniref:endo-polygalacturonase n=1 Tax=Ananas comosus TaxID=4615 RepID=A0A199UH80_ANACO|nr:Polygalacturonase [Ananas comosus]